MTLNQFSTFMYTIIIFVSTVDAANSCIQEWLSMRADTAEGKAFFFTFCQAKESFSFEKIILIILKNL